APALAVALSGDGGIAAALAPDAPGSQHDVDCAEDVLDAMRVMLDAARMQEEARFRRSPNFGCLPDRALGDAGDFRRARGSPLVDVRGDGIETNGVVVDEVMIEPVVLDHQAQNAVKKGDVAPGLDREKQIRGARNRRDSRIDDDDLRAVFARLP